MHLILFISATELCKTSISLCAEFRWTFVFFLFSNINYLLEMNRRTGIYWSLSIKLRLKMVFFLCWIVGVRARWCVHCNFIETKIDDHGVITWVSIWMQKNINKLYVKQRRWRFYLFKSSNISVDDKLESLGQSTFIFHHFLTCKFLCSFSQSKDAPKPRNETIGRKSERLRIEFTKWINCIFCIHISLL